MKIVFVNDDLHVGVDPHKLSLYKNTWYVMLAKVIPMLGLNPDY